ncbi:Coiled-coil domain-containing protein 27, partial [Galemys pyrenaicus]
PSWVGLGCCSEARGEGRGREARRPRPGELKPASGKAPAGRFYGDICDATRWQDPRAVPLRPPSGMPGLHRELALQAAHPSGQPRPPPMGPSRGPASCWRESTPRLMARGLRVLQGMTSRDAQARQWEPRSKPGPPGPPSRLAQACGLQYRRMTKLRQDPEDACFMAKLEELRQLFLTRPGCPQFSTRATSMTQFGKALPEPHTKEPREGRRAAFQAAATLPAPAGRPLPSSRSACEFRSLRGPGKSPPQSPAPGQSPPSKRTPWYVSVIHEKAQGCPVPQDHSLVLLEAEVQRLSQLEAQVQRKDEEILELQGEKETLKKHLKCLLRSRGQDLVGSGQWRAVAPGPWEDRWALPPEEYPVCDLAEDLDAATCEEDGPEGGSEREEAAGGGAGEDRPAREGGKEQEGPEERVLELEEEGDDVVLERPDAGRGRSDSLDEAFEQELMAQLQEYEQAFQEFQFELEILRTRYSLAIGAITSLQRQVDFQESQLQKTSMENEMLEKELRERKHQLQTMSQKFSSLREEKKHEEMLGLTEKDNLLLRQQVLDLELALRKREHTISQLEAKVGQLQEQASLQQNHLQRWKHLQEEMQNKHEMVQQAEQQASVALESFQSRAGRALARLGHQSLCPQLERLRSKIIQATFSTTGVKSATSEISDGDILEALQTIISERSEYYNQLKQKGVKVPPLHQSEAIPSPSKPKKPASK